MTGAHLTSPGQPALHRASHGPRPPMSRVERVLAAAGYHATVYRRTWRGSVVSRALMPVLFLLSMGVGLGSLVDHRAGGVHGMPYLQFVVPAILAVQTMWVANGESTYQVLGYIKWNMTYHAQLATPLTVRDLLGGHFLVVAFHLFMSTSLFMVVAAAFGGFHTWWALLCLPVAMLTGLAFSAPMFAFTATQDGDNGFNILFRWVITPMMLFSGTFFPIEQLPAWMQPIAWATPLWHGVEACRAIASGSVAWAPLLGHLMVPLAYAVVGALLAERTFTKRLAP